MNCAVAVPPWTTLGGCRAVPPGHSHTSPPPSDILTVASFQRTRGTQRYQRRSARRTQMIWFSWLWSKFDRSRPFFGRARPELGRSQPGLSELDPNSVEFDPTLANVHRIRPRLGRTQLELRGIRHELGGVRPDFGGIQPNVGRIRPELGHVRPDFGRVRPDFGRSRPGCGQVRPKSGQSRPQFGRRPIEVCRIRPNSAEFNELPPVHTQGMWATRKRRLIRTMIKMDRILSYAQCGQNATPERRYPGGFSNEPPVVVIL